MPRHGFKSYAEIVKSTSPPRFEGCNLPPWINIIAAKRTAVWPPNLPSESALAPIVKSTTGLLPPNHANQQHRFTGSTTLTAGIYSTRSEQQHWQLTHGQSSVISSSYLRSSRCYSSAAEPDLKATLRDAIPAKRELLKKVKGHASKTIGEVKVENTLGGMRQVDSRWPRKSISNLP
ncbi:MAG: hypothetical protein Q9199_002932 [Rusavskia elegans]